MCMANFRKKPTMEAKTTLKAFASGSARQLDHTRRKIKNLLLRNLLRTNKKILRNMDISNVVLF